MIFNKNLKILFILFFLFFTRFLYAVTVNIPEIKGNPGSVVEIPINIDNGSGIVGFQFSITFDNSILNLIGVIPGSLTQNWQIIINNTKPGEISIIGFEQQLTEISNGSGELCIMKFKVVGSPGQTTDLIFKLSKLSNKNAESISFTSNNGSFIVYESGGGGGCFIATVCFGNYNHPFVKILRQFRDKCLLKNYLGEKFVKWYYKNSPHYAKVIKNNLLLKNLTKIFLMFIVIFVYLYIHKIVYLLIILLVLVLFFKKIILCK